MPKSNLPIFHIPIGRHRRNGDVVLFENKADQDDAMATWCPMAISHPATVAAGACVIIGPTTTSYMDLQTRMAWQSGTADGAWKPSAATDPPDTEGQPGGAP